MPVRKNHGVKWRRKGTAERAPTEIALEFISDMLATCLLSCYEQFEDGCEWYFAACLELDYRDCSESRVFWESCMIVFVINPVKSLQMQGS